MTVTTHLYSPPPPHTNAMQRASNFTNFQEMTEEFQKTLRHDDFTYTTDLCTNLAWMETMVASLSHLQNSKFRCHRIWPLVTTPIMKGTEVSNPRRSSACDCTCVLTRTDHCLVTLSCACLCKVHSRISDALSQALCNLSLAYPDFTLSDTIALIAFSCKLHSAFRLDRNGMITAFTYLPSYRHSSFTLRAYLCWRHTYCQWPIIELAMNVSPKNKMAASHMVQNHIHMCVFCGVKKWLTYHVAVCCTNRKRSSFTTKHFQRKSLKISDFHLPSRRLVSFVARINT